MEFQVSKKKLFLVLCSVVALIITVIGLVIFNQIETVDPQNFHEQVTVVMDDVSQQFDYAFNTIYIEDKAEFNTAYAKFGEELNRNLAELEALSAPLRGAEYKSAAMDLVAYYAEISGGLYKEMLGLINASDDPLKQEFSPDVQTRITEITLLVGREDKKFSTEFETKRDAFIADYGLK